MFVSGVELSQNITKAGIVLDYHAGNVRVFVSIEEAPNGDGILKYRNYGFLDSYSLDESDPIDEQLSVTFEDTSCLLGVYEVDLGTPIPFAQ